MTIQESLTETGEKRREYAQRVGDALFTNLVGVAAINQMMAQAHKDWREHFDGCASCRYYPKGCETGNRLDEIATMWERRLTE